jgi:hypothetical protein
VKLEETVENRVKLRLLGAKTTSKLSQYIRNIVLVMVYPYGSTVKWDR